MAQVIQPEEWVQGLDDNRLLPGRYTTGLFTGNIQGSNKSIANNPAACRVWDIVIPDYITDYDDRRLNGHANVVGNSNFNKDGRDGWGASAYGVFQDVKFDSRVYTMGRHRSVAFRIFDEMQYSGAIGEWGTSTASNVVTPGQALMQTAALIAKTRDLWEQEVLGPDIDKYNIFAVLNGHISGRWVATDPDQIMQGDASTGQWVAQPGPVQGQAIPPRFAPIHGIEWDDNNIPLMLQNIKVTWTNLFIPETNRVCMIDPYYEYPLLMALTGGGIPATEAAYSDIQNGKFTKLMGWEFNFEMPSQYWPKLYFDANMNVVHSADGAAAYDAMMRSQDFSAHGNKELLFALADATRVNKANYIRTIWDASNGKFKKIVTNYPLGMPAASPYYGDSIEVAAGAAVDPAFGKPTAYPWAAQGSGYGLPVGSTTGKFPDGVTAGPSGLITLRQVIGCFVYRPAAQLSQEYSSMLTGEGGTRGKFTECVMDVKYDAWVIESLSHGIIPIVDDSENTGVYGIPVRVISDIKNATVAAESGTTVLWGHTVSDLQSNVVVSMGKITGTLANVTSGALPDVWGEGHFLVLKFSDIDPAASSVKVGLNPTVSSGMVELDADMNAALKVTDKDHQKLLVVTTVDGVNHTQKFDLSDLTLSE